VFPSTRFLILETAKSHAELLADTARCPVLEVPLFGTIFTPFLSKNTINDVMQYPHGHHEIVCAAEKQAVV